MHSAVFIRLVPTHRAELRYVFGGCRHDGAGLGVSQSKRNCPEIIASLLPGNGSIRGGSCNATGAMGMGNGSADLSFTHPCIADTKYPARISLAVTFYGGEAAKLLKMQGDAADRQTLQSAARGFEKSGGSVRREKLAGGEIVYGDFTTECPAPRPAGLPALLSANSYAAFHRISRDKSRQQNVKLFLREPLALKV